MRNLKYLFLFLTIYLFISFPIYANNPPDYSHSSFSAASQAPADGHSTITATITLKDSSGNPLSGDSVTFIDSTNSSAIFSPTSASLNSSGQTTFTIASYHSGTDNISISDTSSNTTLNNLGQVTFTVISAGTCYDPPPGGTPQLVSAVSTGLNKILLTWTDAAAPVSYYLLAFGVAPGQYIYGNPNIGPRGTTTYTVGSLSTGKKYYFAIKAVNGCQPGNFSNEVSATAGEIVTPTLAPTKIITVTLTPTPVPPTATPYLYNQGTSSSDVSGPTVSIAQPTLAPTRISNPFITSTQIKLIGYIIVCILAVGSFGVFIYKEFYQETKEHDQMMS